MASNTTGMEDALEQQNVKPARSHKYTRRPSKVRGDVWTKKSGGGRPQKAEISHAALERDIHTRFWAEKALVGRTLTLRGAEIHIEPPIKLNDPSSPPWSGDKNPLLSSIQLFTDTSKMGAPSFSLPVGPPSFGGSCPGSLGAMTTAPATKQTIPGRSGHVSQRQFALHVINGTNPRLPNVPANVDHSYAVCQNCYVSKGNHAMYWGNNLRIVTRYAWTRAAVTQGLFASSIIEAMKHVQFPAEPPALAHLGQRYFRIHDAGDFYDQHYLAAWHAIAKAYDGNTPGQPRTVFWAPTRIWATDWGIAAVAKVNGGANFLDNFVIRPSGYIIDAAGPEIRPIGRATGFASPTTVDTKAHAEAVVAGKAPRTFDWMCPAQESEEGSCLSSPSPTGSLGCRVCWVHPQLRTCYKLH